MTPQERNDLADLLAIHAKRMDDGDYSEAPSVRDVLNRAAEFIRTAVPWEVVEPIVEFTADAAELDQWKPEPPS